MKYNQTQLQQRKKMIGDRREKQEEELHSYNKMERRVAAELGGERKQRKPVQARVGFFVEFGCV